ncbi:Hypothetical protein CINCED_3A018217 [Cinara cedri]|uniref:Uncharacterized protein n=1 Tax=Cinara cedri TaxID=506608 RepID=A0A5E4N035_9HEMI|nr:Hypothetical protein CINCED_3A018217 [Cinara cedri]
MKAMTPTTTSQRVSVIQTVQEHTFTRVPVGWVLSEIISGSKPRDPTTREAPNRRRIQRRLTETHPVTLCDTTLDPSGACWYRLSSSPSSASPSPHTGGMKISEKLKIVRDGDVVITEIPVRSSPNYKRRAKRREEETQEK